MFKDPFEMVAIVNVIKYLFLQVVVFTLVSSANDWLSDEWDTELRRREEEAERRILEAEEAEKKKFHGKQFNDGVLLTWILLWPGKEKETDGFLFTFSAKERR